MDSPPRGSSHWQGLPADVLSRVTHIVFAAHVKKPTDAELVEVNDARLQGTLDAVHRAGGPLRHVTLYQGDKAYGHHLGFFNTPATEGSAPDCSALLLHHRGSVEEGRW